MSLLHYFNYSMSQPSSNTPLLVTGEKQHPGDHRLNQAKTQVQSATRLVSQNIDLSIERGQNLNALDDKSILLEEESERFKHSSVRVRRNACLGRYRVMIITAAIVAVFIILIVLAIKL